MSDLSFLIQNENQVQVDESFLQKYQKQPTKRQKNVFKNIEEVQTPKKQIKLKKKMTEIQSRKKKFPIKSYTSQHFPAFEQKKPQILNPQQRKYSQNNESNSREEQNQKYFQMIENKISDLLSNQKKIEQQISSNLFQVKYSLQCHEKSNKSVMSTIEKSKGEIRRTQKGIGELLNLIQKHSERRKSKDEYSKF